MATEQFIEGKHDDGHHDGRRSNVLREKASEQEIVDFWEWFWPEYVALVRAGKKVEEIGLDTRSEEGVQ